MQYPDNVNYWKEVAEKHSSALAEAIEKINYLEDIINNTFDSFEEIYRKSGRTLP